MPSRANQMSPENAYSMAGSRWGTMIKVLTNKKALDDAFRQHTWQMQRQAATDQEAMKRVKMQGTFGLAEKQMGVNALNTPEGRAQAAVIKWGQQNGIDFSDPLEQPKIQAAYQFFLTGAFPAAATAPEMAAGGSAAPETKGGGFNFFWPPSWGGGTKTSTSTPGAVPNRAPGSAAPAFGSDASGTVRMKSPDGRSLIVPRKDVQKLIQAGATLVK